MKQKIIIVLIGLSLLATACSSSTPAATETPATNPTAAADGTIIAEGRLEPIRYAEIAFTASGIVSEVLVEEGQAVKKGDPLIRLGDASDKNYAAALLELADAQKALNDLQDTGSTDLAQAVIDLKDAKEEYDEAVDYLDYLENDDRIPQTEQRRFLVQTWKGYQYEIKTKAFKGPAPEDWITEAKNDVSLKKAKVDELQRTYDRLKGGVDAEQLPVLEARVAAAQAGVAAFSVTAPFDGVVAALPAKLGNSINAGEPAVTVADFSHWVVNTTDLTEIDVVELKEGAPVVITLDALPDVELKGTISSIGQTFAENQGDVVYEVTVMLTDTDPAMRWGMTAEVKFE
ncbi:MAG: efflux RND transporter periplasmic adaptor subunit [Chloroflexota bacterium]|nr:HlyD family efflux transporter periplasmic adaptor subunit [Anaerolineales bacterium]